MYKSQFFLISTLVQLSLTFNVVAKDWGDESKSLPITFHSAKDLGVENSNMEMTAIPLLVTETPIEGEEKIINKNYDGLTYLGPIKYKNPYVLTEEDLENNPASFSVGQNQLSFDSEDKYFDSGTYSAEQNPKNKKKKKAASKNNHKKSSNFFNNEDIEYGTFWGRFFKAFLFSPLTGIEAGVQWRNSKMPYDFKLDLYVDSDDLKDSLPGGNLFKPILESLDGRHVGIEASGTKQAEQNIAYKNYSINFPFIKVKWSSSEGYLKEGGTGILSPLLLIINPKKEGLNLLTEAIGGSAIWNHDSNLTVSFKLDEIFTGLKRLRYYIGKNKNWAVELNASLDLNSFIDGTFAKVGSEVLDNVDYQSVIDNAIEPLPGYLEDLADDHAADIADAMIKGFFNKLPGYFDVPAGTGIGGSIKAKIVYKDGKNIFVEYSYMKRTSFTGKTSMVTTYWAIGFNSDIGWDIKK